MSENNGVAEITAEQAQAIIQAEKQRNAREFLEAYNALCQQFSLVLVARVVITSDGRLQAVIDSVSEL